MSHSPAVSDEELHAFIDDELTAARRGEVAQALCHDPALAARVAAFAADRDRLRAALAGIAEQPLPRAWAERIEAATRPRRPVLSRRVPSGRVLSRRYAMAASLALIFGGSAIGVLFLPRRRTILAEAEAARGGRGRVLRDLPADSIGDPGLRAKLLLTALGMPVRAPDLGRFGFRLVRLEILDHAAQLRYGDARGRLLTIYVRPSNGDVRFDLLRRGDTRICVWQDDVVGAVIMAPMAAGEMMRIASSAYRDLNL